MRVLVRFKDGTSKVMREVFVISYVETAGKYYYEFRMADKWYYGHLVYEGGTKVAMARYRKELIRDMEISDK